MLTGEKPMVPPEHLAAPPAKPWAQRSTKENPRGSGGFGLPFWSLLGLIGGIFAALFLLPRYADRLPPELARFLPPPKVEKNLDPPEPVIVTEPLPLPPRPAPVLTPPVAVTQGPATPGVDAARLEARIAALDAALADMRAAQARMGETLPALTALAPRLSALEDEAGSITGQLDTIASRGGAADLPPDLAERLRSLEALAEANAENTPALEAVAALEARLAEVASRVETGLDTRREAVDAREARLAALESGANAMAETLDTLDSRLEQAPPPPGAPAPDNARVEALTAQVEALESALAPLSGLPARLDGLDTTVGTLTAPLDERLDGLEARLGAVQAIARGAADRMAQFDTRETEAQALAAEVETLSRTIAALPAIAPLADRLDTLEAETTALAGLTTQLDAIDARVGTTRGALETLLAGPDAAVLAERLDEIGAGQAALREQLDTRLTDLRAIAEDARTLAINAADAAAESSGAAAAATARAEDAIDAAAANSAAVDAVAANAVAATAVAANADAANAPAPVLAPPAAPDGIAPPEPVTALSLAQPASPPPAPPLDPRVRAAVGNLRVAMDAARPFIRELSELEALLGASAPLDLRAPSYGGLASRPSLLTTFDIGADAAIARAPEVAPALEQVRLDLTGGRLAEALAGIEFLPPDVALSFGPLAQRLGLRIAAETALLQFVEDEA